MILKKRTLTRLVALAAAFTLFAIGTAKAQGPRLLEAELTLANMAPAETLEITENTAPATLDDERPPRPIRPPARTSAGYASGRWPLMIGLSLLTAGIAVGALFGTTTCYASRERFTNTDIPASISIGLGVSLTLAGSIRLARLPGLRRRPRLSGAIVGTALMSILSLGVLALPLLPSWAGCVSS